MLNRIQQLPFVGPYLYTVLLAGSEMSRRDGFEIAGYIAYSAMFALFPFLVFLASLGSFIGNEQSVRSFVNYIIIYLPKDVADTLVPVVMQVIASPRGGLLTVGLLGTIWSAASGIDALRLALNRAYKLTETRSYFLRKGQSFLFVLGGVVVVFAVSILIILGPYLWKVASYFVPTIEGDAAWWHIGRYIAGLLVLTLALILLHRWLPNKRIAWRDTVPGAVFTTLLWTLSATAFSYYLGKFAHYGATYGSLGGVIATLLFFYLTALVFILGGEVNAVVWGQRHPDAEKVNSAPSPEPLSA